MAIGPGTLSDAVPYGVERTERPWELDIDSIVVPVGTGLGSLGEDLRDEYPGAGWESIPYERVTPERPYVLRLPGTGPAGARRLTLALLATPHEGGMLGQPTMAAVRAATAGALRAAANADNTAVGLPLLSAGTLGVPAPEVAAVVVPTALRTLESLAGSSLRRIVFFGRDEETETAIRSALAGFSATDGLGAESYSDVELAGGVSSDLVDPNTGIPLSHDQLGFAPYVSMLATVVADRNTPLPLSIGVFGEWGSGKSYFMGLLREQVDRLAASGNSSYCSEIVQIGFNAWHYADSNLWASLGDEIFRQLAGPEPDAGQRRERLRGELADRLEQRRELADATDQARETVAALQASVDEAIAARRATVRDLIAAMRGSSRLRVSLDELWHRIGIHDEVEQGNLLAEQLAGTLDDSEAIRRSATHRLGRTGLVGAGALAAVCVVATVLAPAIGQWLAGAAALFAGLAGGGTVLMARARSAVRLLRELGDDLRAGLDRETHTKVEPQVAQTLQRLRRAQADQRVAEAQLDEVVARVGELGGRLAELTPGRRIYSFLVDRAQSDSYGRNLGLISTIRKDFAQLVELMADWRANPDQGDAPRRPMDRIVLYIDDLDRCDPRQVVEVLEAVHLLLALELFVVVVGVDPRWLLRSLCSHYDELLDSDPATAGRWEVTPEDYLEKIINIPLILPGMSSGSLRRLLRSIVEDTPGDRTGPPQDTLVAAGAGRPAAARSVAEVLQPTVAVEPGSEVDSQ
jgi:hypothetical protein